MPTSTDMLRAKTDAELLFFVENPSFYQPDLVETAWQELRRRGIRPAAMAAATPASITTDYPDNPDDEAPARRTPWVVAATLALALAVAAGGFFALRPARPVASAGARPDRLSPDSLKLETVAPLPAFDPEQNVDRQLALVPAAEKTQAQALRQFTGLSRRFWRAQNPSVYLIQQSDKVLSYPVFTNQLALVQSQWNDLYKGLVYSYDLPPTMADHLARMRVIARIQRATLKELQADCDNQKPLELAGRTQLAQDTAQHLLQPLQQRTAGLKVQL